MIINSDDFNECFDAEEIMNILWNANTVITDITYHCAMQRCHQLADYKTALRIFDLMYKNDITQTIDSYNILIQCLCDCDRVPLGYKYYVEMKQKAIIPSMETLRIILSGCKQRANYLNIAELIWKDMIFEYQYTPTMQICNLMISIYTKSGDVHKAEIVWNHLIQNEYNIDSVTCMEMIYCFGIKKDKRKIENIQYLMKTKNINMDHLHYYGLIRYYLSIGDVHQVLLLFDDIKKQSIQIDDRLLYQLCITYLRLNKPGVIIKDLTTKYPKLFEQNLDLQGLLFEAQIIKYAQDPKELVLNFRKLLAEDYLTGYWTQCKDNQWWIDLHGIYRTNRMIGFILKYIFQFERKYIENEMNNLRNVVILCGRGVHSNPGFAGTTKTNTEKELLSWNPPIRCKIHPQYNACLIVNHQDIEHFFQYHNKVEYKPFFD